MGIVGNANYSEMFDFMAGFFGIDICGDDGRLLGRWPWEPQEGPRPVSAAAQAMHEKFFSKEAIRGRPAPRPTRGLR